MAVSDEIRIRRAVAGDEGLLGLLCASVQELHFRERPDVFKEPDVHCLEEWFRSTMATESVEVLIAEVGAVPAGYALVRHQHRDQNVFCHERRWGEVEQIGVSPDYRRHGVARSLLSQIVESAKAAGLVEVELNTWSFNQSAHRAFGRLGFETKNLRFGRRIEVR